MNERDKRVLSWPLKIRIFFGGFRARAFAGWLMLTACLLWVVPYSPFAKPHFFDPEGQQAEAIVESVWELQPLPFLIREIQMVGYSFTLENGITYSGSDWTTDELFSYSESEKILVLYEAGNPNDSQLIVSERVPMTENGIFAGLGIGVLGFCVVLLEWARSLRVYQILRRGVLTTAKYVETDRGRADMSLLQRISRWLKGSEDSYIYEVEEQNYIKRVRAHASANRTDSGGSGRDILYHPTHPQESIIPASLPGSPLLGEKGRITLSEGSNKIMVVLNMLVPIIALEALIKLWDFL